MTFSTSLHKLKINYKQFPVTMGLMSLNIIIFMIMSLSGVSIISPSLIDLIAWGGNYDYLTLTGDTWRLLTNIFVHSGIFHILFNMYALYIFGTWIERLFGHAYAFILYILTGITASLASSWWYLPAGTALFIDLKNINVVSVGASGAIMGFSAALLMLVIRSKQRHYFEKVGLSTVSLIIVMVINLLFGFLVTGIDNAAHLGGVMGGILLAWLFRFSEVSNVKQRWSIRVIGLVIYGLALGYTLWHLQKHALNFMPLRHALLAELSLVSPF